MNRSQTYHKATTKHTKNNTKTYEIPIKLLFKTYQEPTTKLSQICLKPTTNLALKNLLNKFLLTVKSTKHVSKTLKNVSKLMFNMFLLKTY